MIIVEYCRFGNLQTYLLNNRKDFVNQLDEFGNMKADDDETEYSVAKDKYGYLIPISSKDKNPLESEMTTLLDTRLSEINSASIISEFPDERPTGANQNPSMLQLIHYNPVSLIMLDIIPISGITEAGR